MVSCYDPQVHRRRSIRLQGYDYAQAGAYFVTLCTHNRECLLGQIEDGLMVLNPVGELIRNEWLRSAEIRTEIELHEFVLMPNHFHATVVIAEHDDHRGGDQCRGDDRCRGDRPVAPTGPKPKSLGALIAGFKSSATKRINEMRGTPGVPVWQRNYYEHIIRDENDYTRIAEYVADNPRRWAEDSLNPNAAVGAARGVGATGRSPLRGTRGGRDE